LNLYPFSKATWTLTGFKLELDLGVLSDKLVIDDFTVNNNDGLFWDAFYYGFSLILFIDISMYTGYYNKSLYYFCVFVSISIFDTYNFFLNHGFTNAFMDLRWADAGKSTVGG